MSYCEIVDKETGDRVNVAAGVGFWIILAGLAVCAGARIHQEITKHHNKQANKAQQVQMMKAAQNAR